LELCKRDEVRGEQRKVHNEELHNLYTSSNIITLLKSRIMRWAGHVARKGQKRKCTRIWWEVPKERNHSEDRGVDGISMDRRETGWGEGGE
jgi:hypothetical protein